MLSLIHPDVRLIFLANSRRNLIVLVSFLDLQSRTEYAKGVVGSVAQTALQLEPPCVLSNFEADKLLPLQSWRKDIVGVSHGSGRKAKKYVAKGDWGSSTTEAVLQRHAVGIGLLLNAMPDQQLFWDFTISSKPTLGPFKPDGHARLMGAKSPLQASNVLQMAVLVELKATPSLLSDDTQGTCLIYRLGTSNSLGVNAR